MRHFIPAALFVASFFAPAQASAADVSGAGATYTDSRGKKIVFPMGAASFADEVVSFDIGSPAGPPKWSDPNLVLGAPDYIDESQDDKKPGDLTLGCGGSVVVRFNHVALVDVPGPDLYLFEVGPAVEPMHVAISTDGKHWIEVGDVPGATAAVDIAKVAVRGDSYHYVKVTDLKSACSGQWPGADLDAVGAIGAALTINLDASVLFDFNKAQLKPEAKEALTAAAATIAAQPVDAAIQVAGHTDNVGSASYNQRLSQARATAVKKFLAAVPALAGRAMSVKGYGATRPLASNDTDEGRQKNRRVEVVVRPK